jgi:hypothetical protein
MQRVYPGCDRPPASWIGSPARWIVALWPCALRLISLRFHGHRLPAHIFLHATTAMPKRTGVPPPVNVFFRHLLVVIPKGSVTISRERATKCAGSPSATMRGRCPPPLLWLSWAWNWYTGHKRVGCTHQFLYVAP